MIRLQRSAKIRKMFPETAAWAKGIADFINTKCPDTKVEVFVACYGDISTIYWYADFDNMLALNNWQRKLMSDAAYWEKISDAYDFLVVGSIVDTVMVTA
jgi:hypothetical protein